MQLIKREIITTLNLETQEPLFSTLLNLKGSLTRVFMPFFILETLSPGPGAYKEKNSITGKGTYLSSQYKGIFSFYY